MSQRQITLPTDDLDFILDILNEKRCDLIDANMKQLMKNGGNKTDNIAISIDKREKLYNNIKRINKHILMTFIAID